MRLHYLPPKQIQNCHWMLNNIIVESLSVFRIFSPWSVYKGFCLFGHLYFYNLFVRAYFEKLTFKWRITSGSLWLQISIQGTISYLKILLYICIHINFRLHIKYWNWKLKNNIHIFFHYAIILCVLYMYKFRWTENLAYIYFILGNFYFFI